MELFESFVFWNPWWNEEQDWVEAVERDACLTIQALYEKYLKLMNPEGQLYPPCLRRPPVRRTLSY